MSVPAIEPATIWDLRECKEKSCRDDSKKCREDVERPLTCIQKPTLKKEDGVAVVIFIVAAMIGGLCKSFPFLRRSSG